MAESEVTKAEKQLNSVNITQNKTTEEKEGLTSADSTLNDSKTNFLEVKNAKNFVAVCDSPDEESEYLFDRKSRSTTNESKLSLSTVSNITRRLNRNRTTRRHKENGGGGFKKRGRTLRRTIRNTLHAVNDSTKQYGSMPTNEQRLRTFVLKEILETEREYKKLLDFMVNEILPNLNALAVQEDFATPVSNESISTLLSNIAELRKVHEKLCHNIEKSLEPIPYHNHCIGQTFIDLKDEFHVYDTYCSNFTQAQAMAYTFEKDTETSKLIEKWKTTVESKSRRFIHLEDFVISPVQRICKYPLLLRELLKYTPSNHTDHKNVKEAHKLMENVTHSVNESERMSLMLQAIKDVEKVCDSWEESGYFTEPVDNEPVGEIDLTSYKDFLPDCSNEVNRPYAFGFSDRTYYMYATSETEKGEWLSIFKWKIECIDRTRRQARNPFETAVFSSLSSFLNPRSIRQSTSADFLSENSSPASTVQSPDKLRNKKSMFSRKGNKKSRSKSMPNLNK